MKLVELLDHLKNKGLITLPTDPWRDCYLFYDHGFVFSAGFPGHGSVTINTGLTINDLERTDWMKVDETWPE